MTIHALSLKKVSFQIEKKKKFVLGPTLQHTSGSHRINKRSPLERSRVLESHLEVGVK